MGPKLSRDNMKKGIYIVPNLITTTALFFGFASLMSSFQGDFNKAAWAIMLAGIFDMLDGKVARLTKTTSKFGIEYDSLSDLISFGIAPAMLAFTWALMPFGRSGWLAAFLYVVCAALRLARFNVQSETVEKDKFKGLPSPGAAGMIAATVLFYYHLGGSGALPEKHITLLLMVYSLAFLMVSNVGYWSSKDMGLGDRKPFSLLVISILVIILVIAEPEVMLFVIGVVYALSGPFEHMLKLIKRQFRTKKTKTKETETLKS
ncbi:MAG: CDP-diacylglycerol--serine O-phosphatidyltransferase [bacterium]|nr:CDP-diacylglycerol--serine O-phosphatidyltransferase [bacterium]